MRKVAGARTPSTKPHPLVRAPWIENRPQPGWVAELSLRELWSYREVAYQLALRDLKVRYKQTAVGVLWVIVQPAAATLVFTLVLGAAAGLPSDGLPYSVFVLAGLTGWLSISSSVSAAAECLVEGRDLVTKSYFPRVLAPVAACLPGLVDLAPALAALGVLMAIEGVQPSASILTLPVWIGAGLLVALGAGLWLSALNALYRDVRYAIGFVLQIWLFASPVVYPSSLVEGPERSLFALNPLVGVLDGLRWALLDAPAPPVQDLASLAVGVLLLVTGLLYFQRVERQMADRI